MLHECWETIGYGDQSYLLQIEAHVLANAGLAAGLGGG